MTTCLSDCPCKDCRVRRIGCHSTCERYKTWRFQRSEVLERVRARKDAYTDHNAQPFWRKYRKSRQQLGSVEK